MLTMTTGGLLLDMLGVALLFIYPPSLPEHEKSQGVRVTTSPELKATRARLAKKRAKSNRIARVALVAIFIGFGPQLWAQLL
ncbi:hypothetical protein [Halomonas lysinitropha]|uniref:Uncharacterized protein n=1 Tax=Halomonas lysinitropha TaxID=2607506 RepID=A0A5K1I958_9GAMM|nr:hypothetical protein [Halomonas lysinitropha]VVZ96520.1 hypothetical protein HALO32_02621 [Halomonas lysinitropha]